MIERITRRLWRTHQSHGRAPWLFSHKALAKVFRARLLAALAHAGLSVPRTPARWVVDCKAVGNGAKALVYLGRYLYRGVIREQDILACKDGQVTPATRTAKPGAGRPVACRAWSSCACCCATCCRGACEGRATMASCIPTASA